MTPLWKRRHEPPAQKPSSYDSAQIDIPDVIDLREPPRPKGDLAWGMPSRCPECGDHGYLDKIDLTAGIMYQHCPTCWARWTVTQDEIEAQDAAR
jgi:hypothetical protein